MRIFGSLNDKGVLFEIILTIAIARKIKQDKKIIS